MKQAYKGFDENMQCRGFQYEIGQKYEIKGEVEACSYGFHACSMPLSVFSYYPPANNRFALVEQSGELDERGDKTASSEITVKMELSLFDMAKAQIEWVKSSIKKEGEAIEEEDYSAASNTGDQSAASNTGYQSAASNTGDYSAASNTGNYSAASNTGNYSAASNTGDQSAASNTGYQSAASVEGDHSIAFVSGRRCRAKASSGSWIVVTERNEVGEILAIKTAEAGNGIEPDTYYELIDGEFVISDCQDD